MNQHFPAPVWTSYRSEVCIEIMMIGISDQDVANLKERVHIRYISFKLKPSRTSTSSGDKCGKRQKRD